jgi:hypothetical protein
MLHTLLDLFGVALFFACYTYALGSEAAPRSDDDQTTGLRSEALLFEC